MRNGIKWLYSLWGNKKALEIKKSWEYVFSSNEAKDILKDLAYYCNFYSSSFVKNDANATAFNEGARDVFLHILEMIDIDVSQINKIIEKE